MFDKLLEEFKSVSVITEERNDRTIFEVCGFPHYEIVVSNVLSFFFDYRNQHDLNGLLIKSLLEAAGIDEDVGLQFQSEREVMTNKRGYIDILLHNDYACIVIENKIYSGLNNDLDDYLSYAKGLGRKYTYGILLALYETDPQESDFINVTYSNFIAKIRKNLGCFVGRSYNKYLFLLIELINNLEELQTGGMSMNSEFVKFVKDNYNEVRKFSAELKRYHDDLRRVVREVNSIVVEKIKSESIKQWAWRDPSDGLYDVAVTDIKLDNGIGIAIDSKIDCRGWRFEIFVRNNPGKDFSISDFCNKQGFNGKLEGGRFVLNDTFPIDAKPYEIAGKIVDIIKRITKPSES